MRDAVEALGSGEDVVRDRQAHEASVPARAGPPRAGPRTGAETGSPAANGRYLIGWPGRTHRDGFTLGRLVRQSRVGRPVGQAGGGAPRAPE
ncbi:hypothetical protein GCM10027070_22230 [Barrientosiimonas humi]